jgi:hypothetical protein
MAETVDLPVAIEPVRPRRSILVVYMRRRLWVSRIGVEGKLLWCSGVEKLGGKWSDAGSLSCEDAELRRMWARRQELRITRF